jgi:glycerophosphoryl diester phosphodiesterase
MPNRAFRKTAAAAVQRAVRAGYGIEIDVHLSADGRAVVFHDDTLDRLTHTTGPVAKRTARELSDLVLKGSDERIPTLRSDILELVDGQVPILIEIKDQSGAIGEGEDQLERAVAEDLRDYPVPWRS